VFVITPGPIMSNNQTDVITSHCFIHTVQVVKYLFDGIFAVQSVKI